ncbi:hypothetical protein KJ603_02750 [Patescibacteria group bacterium]|nr:hypothetical protein [Patescibacteria group bacterium]
MEHKELAVRCFNMTWDLIDKENRTDGEVLSMIHLAHISRYHWGEIVTPIEWSRGEWQISRVYESGLGDLVLAFAYESIARAFSNLSDDINKKVALEKARTK